MSDVLAVTPATRGYAVRIRIEFVDILKTKLSEIEIQTWEPEVHPDNADEHLEMIVEAVLPLVGSGEVRIFKECWHGTVDARERTSP